MRFLPMNVVAWAKALPTAFCQRCLPTKAFPTAFCQHCLPTKAFLMHFLRSADVFFAWGETKILVVDVIY